MATNSIVLFFTLLFLYFFQSFQATIGEAKINGFTIDLIHRDHNPVSPYYNSSMSPMERLNKEIHRSLKRVAYFNQAFEIPHTIQSHINVIGSSYLMKVAIGSPPLEMLTVVDTGSSLSWTQCEPCPSCYSQINPLFDPARSSSYEKITCQSKLCHDLDTSSCADDMTTCQYKVEYRDGSYSKGNLAFETFTLGSTTPGELIRIPGVAFGCGQDNLGFNESASGLIGLGSGEFSFVNQLSSYINGKFSYCLVPLYAPPNISTKLNFGSNAIVSGPGVLSTPLIKKADTPFYYLTLHAISVGGTKLAYESVSVEEGNIVIDSGTLLTFLPRDFYNSLESTLVASIKGTRVVDPQGVFSLCYQMDNTIEIPRIIVHLTDVDLGLPPSNTFVKQGDKICLAWVPTDDLVVLGSMSHVNLKVGYDLVSNKVFFMATDCTKQ